MATARKMLNTNADIHERLTAIQHTQKLKSINEALYYILDQYDKPQSFKPSQAQTLLAYIQTDNQGELEQYEGIYPSIYHDQIVDILSPKELSKILVKTHKKEYDLSTINEAQTVTNRISHTQHLVIEELVQAYFTQLLDSGDSYDYIVEYPIKYTKLAKEFLSFD